MSTEETGMTQAEVNEALIELMRLGSVLPVRINGQYHFAPAQQRHKVADHLVPVEEAIGYLQRCNEVDAATWN